MRIRTGFYETVQAVTRGRVTAPKVAAELIEFLVPGASAPACNDLRDALDRVGSLNCLDQVVYHDLHEPPGTPEWRELEAFPQTREINLRGIAGNWAALPEALPPSALQAAARLLRGAILAAGQPVLFGAMSFAVDVVGHESERFRDLYVIDLHRQNRQESRVGRGASEDLRTLAGERDFPCGSGPRADLMEDSSLGSLVVDCREGVAFLAPANASRLRCPFGARLNYSYKDGPLARRRSGYEHALFLGCRLGRRQDP